MDSKSLGYLILGLTGAYLGYRMFIKKDKPVEAVKKVISTPLVIAEKIIDSPVKTTKEVVEKVEDKVLPEKKRKSKMTKEEFLKKMKEGREKNKNNTRMVKYSKGYEVFVKSKNKNAIIIKGVKKGYLVRYEDGNIEKVKNSDVILASVQKIPKDVQDKVFFKKAIASSKGGEATAKLGKHKGHKTKKGLAQDQKLISKEEHEVNYQGGK